MKECHDALKDFVEEELKIKDLIISRL